MAKSVPHKIELGAWLMRSMICSSWWSPVPCLMIVLFSTVSDIALCYSGNSVIALKNPDFHLLKVKKNIFMIL